VDWSRLKIGMTAREAATTLGDPLIRTAGQGFEVWIYDARAEVLFYGQVIGWTSPHPAGETAAVVDIWQETKGGTNAPVFFLPRPESRPMLARPATPVDDTNKLPFYRLR
jgi:hypothetical protein